MGALSRAFEFSKLIVKGDEGGELHVNKHSFATDMLVKLEQCTGILFMF